MLCESFLHVLLLNRCVYGILFRTWNTFGDGMQKILWHLPSWWPRLLRTWFSWFGPQYVTRNQWQVQIKSVVLGYLHNVFRYLHKGSLFLVQKALRSKFYVGVYFLAISHQFYTDVSDNMPSNNYRYFVTIHTGSRPNSGTTARVAMTVVGTHRKSEVHILQVCFCVFELSKSCLIL